MNNTQSIRRPAFRNPPESELSATRPNAPQDAYECIDLSDNDLIKLGNFPPLKRHGCSVAWLRGLGG